MSSLEEASQVRTEKKCFYHVNNREGGQSDRTPKKRVWATNYCRDKERDLFKVMKRTGRYVTFIEHSSEKSGIHTKDKTTKQNAEPNTTNSTEKKY